MILGISGGAKARFESLLEYTFASPTFSQHLARCSESANPATLRGKMEEEDGLLQAWFVSVHRTSEDRKPKLTSLVKSELNFKIMIACES